MNTHITDRRVTDKILMRTKLTTLTPG